MFLHVKLQVSSNLVEPSTMLNLLRGDRYVKPENISVLPLIGEYCPFKSVILNQGAAEPFGSVRICRDAAKIYFLLLL